MVGASIKKISSAITGWQKASQAYSPMQKRASGSGFGRNS